MAVKPKGKTSTLQSLRFADAAVVLTVLCFKETHCPSLLRGLQSITSRVILARDLWMTPPPCITHRDWATRRGFLPSNHSQLGWTSIKRVTIFCERTAIGRCIRAVYTWGRWDWKIIMFQPRFLKILLQSFIEKVLRHSYRSTITFRAGLDWVCRPLLSGNFSRSNAHGKIGRPLVGPDSWLMQQTTASACNDATLDSAFAIILLDSKRFLAKERFQISHTQAGKEQRVCLSAEPKKIGSVSKHIQTMLTPAAG